jgi:hypothetical protein
MVLTALMMVAAGCGSRESDSPADGRADTVTTDQPAVEVEMPAAASGDALLPPAELPRQDSVAPLAGQDTGDESAAAPSAEPRPEDTAAPIGGDTAAVPPLAPDMPAAGAAPVAPPLGSPVDLPSESFIVEQRFRANPLRPDAPVPEGPGAPVQPPPVQSAPIQPPPEPPAEVAVSQPSAPPTAEKGPPERIRPVGSSKASNVKIDPIKENGPIFVGWTKPKLALVLSGRQDGYLEPCGCAGLDNMKGGLSRRHSLFRELREQRGWPVVGLDAGGLIKDYGLQAEMKFHTTVEAMRTMGYHGAALGKNDLRLQAGEVLADVQLPGQPALFLSANAGLFGLAAGMTPQMEVYEVAGMKVGVTAIIGKQWQREVNNQDVEFADPEAALAQVVPQLKAKCDLMVLLAHATVDESAELAKKFPQFDVVVTAGGPPEPPLEPRWLDGGKRAFVEVGEKGMYVVVLGLYEGADRRFRYQRVPLDSRFNASPEMTLLMTAYQERLQAAGLEGLGIHPNPHPRAAVQGAFVGSKKCESCHEPSYKVWKKSGHALGWETLVNLKPARNFDPECISCHVVGWHPTNYFPYETGFLSEAETPHLVDVGCEACHGPGEKHINAELGTNEQLRAQFRQAMVITKEESEKHQCMTCHDGDNSPDFNFATYWPLIIHEE